MYDKQHIISITTWIAALVAVAVALLLPLGYFTVSYQYLSGSLAAEAELTSHSISGLINAHPEVWQYEQVRLEELLEQRMRNSHGETRRILDLQNKLVAENGAKLKPPLVTRRFELMDAGVPVGTLEMSTSLFSLLSRTALVALLGVSCGVAIFVTLRVLPLRAVDAAEKSLRESKAELTEKVTQLEVALVKVKQLEGIIPICMYCKKIRNDHESWEQMEAYITEHSEAHFSHGICPECFKKATAEVMEGHT
ncbi:MAG: hypothetical protein A2076_03830 [Geobacteraceae bacterium GWC2_53_11]|nr:MAG: hypothetical protein A2076_03830 [Geobacteraceae bacterium GWC2_53_11]